MKTKRPIDPSGKLTWKSNAIDDEHVITVLSERVSDDYLAFLQSRGVSYVFVGRADIDLRRVLAKLSLIGRDVLHQSPDGRAIRYKRLT